MSKKSKKKNKAKKIKIAKLILSIFICVLMQIGIIYAFFTLLPEKHPINRSDLPKITITVDYTEYIYRPSGWEPILKVYSDGICYWFGNGVLDEPGASRLSQTIQPGDTITVLYSNHDSSKDSVRYVYEAYTDTEIYRDIDKRNKDRKIMRPIVLIVSPFLELYFLLLVAFYFNTVFVPAYRCKKKHKKKKGKKAGDSAPS